MHSMAKINQKVVKKCGLDCFGEVDFVFGYCESVLNPINLRLRSYKLDEDKHSLPTSALHHAYLLIKTQSSTSKLHY